MDAAAAAKRPNCRSQVPDRCCTDNLRRARDRLAYSGDVDELNEAVGATVSCYTAGKTCDDGSADSDSDLQRAQV
jgi:hypothetical protein